MADNKLPTKFDPSTFENSALKELGEQLASDPMAVAGISGGLSKAGGVSKELFQEILKNASNIDRKSLLDFIMKTIKPESVVHDVKPVLRGVHTEALKNKGLSEARDVFKAQGLNPDSVIIDPGMRHFGEVSSKDLITKLRDKSNLGVAEHEAQHLKDLLSNPQVTDLYKQGKLNPSQGLGSMLDPKASKALGVTDPNDLRQLGLMQKVVGMAKEPGNAAGTLYGIPKNEKFIQRLYNEAPDASKAFEHFEGNHFVGDDDITRLLKAIKGE